MFITWKYNTRGQFNRSWFVIHNKVLNFHDWILELSMDLWHLNSTKVISTLWTLNYDDCVPFLVLILSILFTIKATNLWKPYSWISKKHDQTSINLTDVFNFKGWFSNYVGFHEIKLLCGFTKKTAQNL